ncbi:MAG: hypothetical protein KIS66_07790 [Fimbriimonadaceae bacterium]|nr:hypothetical protein [Fimbriimonadaceae bacterium]
MDQHFAMQVAVAQELSRHYADRAKSLRRPRRKRTWIGLAAFAGLFAVLVLTTPRDTVTQTSRPDLTNERVVAERPLATTRT